MSAQGYGQEPDKPYGGRFALTEIVHDEHFGRRWSSDEKSAGQSPKKMFEEIERKTTETLQPA
jgi:hypothetical protein